MTSNASIDPRTPVVVGVAQAAERIDDAGYKGLSPIDLAAAAAHAAIEDTGADALAVIAAVDVIACTRQFENSTPRARAPLGKSTKYPLSVACLRLAVGSRRNISYPNSVAKYSRAQPKWSFSPAWKQCRPSGIWPNPPTGLTSPMARPTPAASSRTEVSGSSA